MQNKAMKITKIVFNTIFYIIILFILLFSVTTLTSNKNNGIPSLFGKGYLSVQSNSMMPSSKDAAKSDSFDKGDLIFVTKLNSNSSKSKLKIGDIITFRDYNLKGELNTHRIVDIYGDDEGNKIGYVTQGDRINALNPYNPDNTAGSGQFEAVAYNQIVAKYTGKWTGAGSTLDWISNPQKGFIIVIILPTMLFLGFEVFLVIKNLMSIKAQKIQLTADADREKLKAELEIEKEQMRKQLLEELKKENELNASKEKEEK